MARWQQTFRAALEDDLNTSQAITCLYDLLKEKELSGATRRAVVADFDRVLSLGLLEEEEKAAPAVDTEQIERMIAARAAAKKAKNYAEADRIRAELSAMGVTLTDTPNGTTYKIG